MGPDHDGIPSPQPPSRPPSLHNEPIADSWTKGLSYLHTLNGKRPIPSPHAGTHCLIQCAMR